MVFPKILESGYRYFSENDVELLKKISVFRKIGIGADDIKAVLADEKRNISHKVSVQKELSVQREKVHGILNIKSLLLLKFQERQLEKNRIFAKAQTQR